MVQLDLIVLKNDLERLSVLIQGLSYANLDQDTKPIVLEMISELNKIYDNIIEILCPFYDLFDKDPANFQSGFNEAFKQYKEANLKNANKFEFHCEEVSKRLTLLAQKKDRIAMLPSTRSMLEEIDSTSNLWVLRDADVYQRITELDEKLDRGLSPINTTLEKGGSKLDAQNELRDFLLESKPSFEQIQLQQKKISNFR